MKSARHRNQPDGEGLGTGPNHSIGGGCLPRNGCIKNELSQNDRSTGDRMTPKVSLRKALEDPELLGSALAGPTWHAWRSLLIAALGDLHQVHRPRGTPISACR